MIHVENKLKIWRVSKILELYIKKKNIKREMEILLMFSRSKSNGTYSGSVSDVVHRRDSDNEKKKSQ